MRIQISFEKYEPVDQNKPMFVIFIYLFIYSFNLVKTMDQILQNICKEKKYIIPPNMYKIIINKYIEVLQIKKLWLLLIMLTNYH